MLATPFRGLAVYLALLLVAGCASNPYQQFYVGQAASSPQITDQVVPATGVQIYSGGDPMADLIVMMEKGYLWLGYSEFNGPTASRRQLFQHAKSVGASTVVAYSRYTNTVAGNAPLVLPAPPTTSVTNVQGSAQGTGGYATYSGTATTTTYGGTTVYNVPYNVNRFDQVASFWVRARPGGLGAVFRELTTEERQQIERNGSVVVAAVVKDSPAYKANLLRDDIVLRVDGVDVQGGDHLRTLLKSHRHEGPMVLDVLRSGVERVIEVPVGP